MPPQARTLHQRLELADAVVIAWIEAVDAGRLRVRATRVLEGDPPESFEIKRSPSRPPPLEEGDRVLLLLRGARAPFVLVDEPQETIRLADDEAETRWGSAVAALLATGDAVARARVYLEWIAEGPATLRDLASAGLTSERTSLDSLPPDLFQPLVDVAWDADRPLGARRTAAMLAARSPHAAEQLLEGVGAHRDEGDVVVGVLALRAGVFHRSPQVQQALANALGSPSAELRLGALRSVAALQPEPSAEFAQRLTALATNDGDERVRAEAQRMLRGRASH